MSIWRASHGIWYVQVFKNRIPTLDKTYCHTLQSQVFLMNKRKFVLHDLSPNFLQSYFAYVGVAIKKPEFIQ